MKSKTRTLCIILGLILIVGLITCAGFWFIIRKSIDSIYAFENAAKNQVANHEDKVALKNLLDEVKPDVITLKTRIIDKGGTVPFINSIEALGRQSGAKANINSVGVSPATEGDSYEQLNFSVSTEGSWSQVYTFLSMVESLPYKVAIPTVSLSQSLYSEAGVASTTKAKTVTQWKGAYTFSVLKNK